MAPITRRSATSLGPDERAALVDAILTLKGKGIYDTYVHAHHEVMVPTTYTWEPRDATYRNGAHRGPAFLPWHRAMLHRFEADLREVDSTVTLPYWDWTADADLTDPHTSSLWSPDLMGGNGVEADGWVVATGPFAHATGNWDIAMDEDGPQLRRRFGNAVPDLPTAADLVLAMGERLYDTPPYAPTPFTIGFRNRIEGWVTQRGDARVATSRSQLHNRVHLWVGGSMVPMTSPNDPVFFLHHAFVDKVWAEWQALQQRFNPDGAPHYAPEKDGPTGHNLNDKMKPWEMTARSVLSISDLGYDYEQPSGADVSRLAAAATPDRVRQSPFWAD